MGDGITNAPDQRWRAFRLLAALGLMGMLSTKVGLDRRRHKPNSQPGSDVTYSGTVTAHHGRYHLGVPGIAVSLDGGDTDSYDLDYGAATDVTSRVVSAVIKYGLPKAFFSMSTFLGALSKMKGILTTKQGLRVYRDRLDKRVDPRGRDYYWIGGDRPTGVPKEGTDVGALAAGYASVTPLWLDLTASPMIETMVGWDWQPSPVFSANGH
ncbi:MAG: hypothetical protein H6663_06485 [Candidatus Promineofilum sp.]|nr:hypothetical protein [Promineifilum sp.]